MVAATAAVGQAEVTAEATAAGTVAATAAGSVAATAEATAAGTVAATAAGSVAATAEATAAGTVAATAAVEPAAATAAGSAAGSAAVRAAVLEAVTGLRATTRRVGRPAPRLRCVVEEDLEEVARPTAAGEEGDGKHAASGSTIIWLFTPASSPPCIHRWSSREG